MEHSTSSKVLLGRTVRVAGELAYVRLAPDFEAVFDLLTIYWLADLFPTGLLRLHYDGKGRRYVDLRCQKGHKTRLLAARVILCRDTPEQKNRQAHYRNKSTQDLCDGNLFLGESGHVSGSDDTWQEVARRMWKRSQGEDPDQSPPEIFGAIPYPPHQGLGEPATFPRIPADRATPVRIRKGGRGGRND